MDIFLKNYKLNQYFLYRMCVNGFECSGAVSLKKFRFACFQEKINVCSVLYSKGPEIYNLSMEKSTEVSYNNKIVKLPLESRL
jgi:hypothetical protein